MDSSNLNLNATLQKPSRNWRWLRFGWRLLAVVAIVLICVMQWIARDLDFAAANVVSVLSGLLLWICLIAELKFSTLPRIAWRTVAFLPLALLALFFLFFKVERFNGELVPIFRQRWESERMLAKQAAVNVAATPALFEPRKTDFPQFLGPNRDGTIAAPPILTNWDSKAPEILWKIPVGDGWSGFAVQGDIAVTMEQRDAQEWVTAYDVTTGELVWSHEFEGLHTHVLGGTGPRGTPTISNGLVYAPSAVSQLVCLELVTGEMRWQQSLLDLGSTTQPAFESEVTWGRSASPLVWNDVVITALGGSKQSGNVQTLIAFDAKTGEERWRAGNDQISYSSPTILNINGSEQLAIISESALSAFSLSDQQLLWSVPWPGSSSGAASVSQPLQVSDNKVFMSKGYGEGCQLLEVNSLTETGEEASWIPTVIWKNQSALRTKFTSAVVHDGYAYGLSDGILECVDLQNGKQMWKRGRYQQGQILLVGSQLLITSERGEIAIVDATPEELRELAKVDVLGDVTWNTPALSGDRLLMRNSDEAAYVRLPLDYPFESHTENSNDK